MYRYEAMLTDSSKEAESIFSVVGQLLSCLLRRCVLSGLSQPMTPGTTAFVRALARLVDDMIANLLEYFLAILRLPPPVSYVIALRLDILGSESRLLP